jgi:hypothetical protein
MFKIGSINNKNILNACFIEYSNNLNNMNIFFFEIWMEQLNINDSLNFLNQSSKGRGPRMYGRYSLPGP